MFTSNNFNEQVKDNTSQNITNDNDKLPSNINKDNPNSMRPIRKTITDLNVLSFIRSAKEDFDAKRNCFAAVYLYRQC